MSRLVNKGRTTHWVGRESYTLPTLSLLTLLLFARMAQAQQPTEEQLELLQSLPPDQQAELLEQFTSDDAAASSDGPLEFPNLTRPDELEKVGDQALIDPEPRIVGDDTIVITFAVPEDISDDDIAVPAALSRLLGTQTYQLSPTGTLLLPGIVSVPLAGLDEETVALRLRAEPALSDLEIEVTILPLEPTGVEALDYFGYDLFDDVPTTFAPATDVPVPSDYLLGPGDTLNVALFGNENRTYSVVVGRDGTIFLRDIGPLEVAGLSFDEVRSQISERISSQKIGVRVNVTAGELRSIRVFVLGDVARPGSYTVSGLSTMTNALFLSGGVSKTGTLRRIELKRNGRRVGRMDLYDLLLRGDTSKDQRLKPGDVIFVPPVGTRVAVSGEVVRPAYYELRGETTASELIQLAGGMTPQAMPNSGRVERLTKGGSRRVLNADQTGDAGRSLPILNGDVLRVFPVFNHLTDSIELVGHVRRPDTFQWAPGLRITDLIPSPEVLQPRADLGYVLIRREPQLDGRIAVVSVDLAAALANPTAPANADLQPRDRVIVFEAGPARGSELRSVMLELERQARTQDEALSVIIDGQVRAPGTYPLESGMTVADLIRAGGGFTPASYLREAELTRFVVGASGERQTQLIPIQLDALLAGDVTANKELSPYDYLTIREIPEWREQETVEIGGEVKFPGRYPIARGETLQSLIQRAGGLTELGFADGSVFTRESLKEREEQQVDTLISRLEADLASLSLQAAQVNANTQQAFTLGQSILSQLRNTTATGRLVIDLDRILAAKPGSDFDISLRGGDRLLIPQLTQEVTVIGEVQYATSHIYDPDLDRDDYISLSGGLTGKADGKRIYVVRANGQVVAASGTRWLRRVGGTEIRAGDTIVVPLDTDRLAPLTLWSSVTQIVYNLAVAVAAVNSF